MMRQSKVGLCCLQQFFRKRCHLSYHILINTNTIYTIDDGRDRSKSVQYVPNLGSMVMVKMTKKNAISYSHQITPPIISPHEIIMNDMFLLVHCPEFA